MLAAVLDLMLHSCVMFFMSDNQSKHDREEHKDTRGVEQRTQRVEQSVGGAGGVACAAHRRGWGVPLSSAGMALGGREGGREVAGFTWGMK